MISTLKKKLNKKGFTLAELLVVVAIIAILVAIAIPVFSSQLENARKSTDEANIRSAYSIAQTATLLQGTSGEILDTAKSPYRFQKDGSFAGNDVATTNDYVMKHTDGTVTVDTVPGVSFAANAKITAKWNSTSSTWEIDAGGTGGAGGAGGAG
ncbi:prepilin-type N-terminal cleavage/methylation domain-containing protein [Oscillibacter valericigenes]|uniref:prepilin-type N-terminal cleavage/methylation domain-containing protein n=1 Tax=Oscillibacter valericigenes TaxID=351091 RepID=UPI002A60D467|nr:prepilin-type N-terminal cleavage/methylation domain-containing protein [Oscillibacter valericigenes]